MNLIIDIGNTQFKVCIFSNLEIVYHKTLDDFNKSFLQKLCAEYPIKRAIYSDTRGIDSEKFKSIFTDELNLYEFNHKTHLPIKIEYLTPETLGKDRIAGAVGAMEHFSGSACLVVDIGTALTIDLINERGVFKGGIISPGPELRYRSLNEFTGKLPKLNPAEINELLGNSTKSAIQCGVQNGIAFEINEYISRLIKEYPDLKIILTGGYTFLFERKINYPIFADSFLVPKGLNRILIYNELQT